MDAGDAGIYDGDSGSRSPDYKAKQEQAKKDREAHLATLSEPEKEAFLQQEQKAFKKSMVKEFVIMGTSLALMAGFLGYDIYHKLRNDFGAKENTSSISEPGQLMAYTSMVNDDPRSLRARSLNTNSPNDPKEREAVHDRKSIEEMREHIQKKNDPSTNDPKKNEQNKDLDRSASSSSKMVFRA